MTTLEVLKQSIVKSYERLNAFYNENNNRGEDCQEAEQIRTNILNLKIMYLKKTTNETNKDNLIDMASNLDKNDFID